MATQAPAGLAEGVLRLTRALRLELHPGPRGVRPATPDPSLEKDLGLDSLTRALALELHPGRRGVGQATLDSSLEKDFGLDSLARAELLVRLERAFGHRLPEALLSSAETPRDLLAALRSSPAGASGLASA